MIQPNLLTKQKEIHTFREQIYGYRVGRRGEGTVREFGMDCIHCCILNGEPTRTYRKRRELCSLSGSLDGRGVGGEWIRVCVWLSPYAVHLKLSQHC